MQYSWIIFPHCSIMTAASRISAAWTNVNCQVSYRVITYDYDFILSLFLYNLNGQKSY